MKVSVTLATHNEEANLAKCLDAVKNFADEIVIADGESEDKTVQIAKKYGAKVIKTTNKANFHINKQLANDAATGEIILQLDADEIVDKELAQFITALLKHPEKDQDISAWWIKRRNWFMGRFLRKGGQYPDPVIRLFRKGQAWLPQKDVHEQMHVEGKVGWAEGHLLHYGNPSFAEYLRKFNTYTSFKADQLYAAGVSISWQHSLQFLLWKPGVTFGSLFIRHKGFVDGVPGFVFAAFSGLHHAVAYLKLWEKYQKIKLKN